MVRSTIESYISSKKFNTVFSEPVLSIRAVAKTRNANVSGDCARWFSLFSSTAVGDSSSSFAHLATDRLLRKHSTSHGKCIRADALYDYSCIDSAHCIDEARDCNPKCSHSVLRYYDDASFLGKWFFTLKKVIKPANNPFRQQFFLHLAHTTKMVPSF